VIEGARELPFNGVARVNVPGVEGEGGCVPVVSRHHHEISRRRASSAGERATADPQGQDCRPNTDIRTRIVVSVIVPLSPSTV